jgi:DNA adenine methylase
MKKQVEAVNSVRSYPYMNKKSCRAMRKLTEQASNGDLTSLNILRKNNSPLKPFLKWAGGKRWFVTEHANLLPKKFDRYIEPFLGSGAVFFYLRPTKAILGDSNSDLIDAYLAIKQNWPLVYRYLRKHQRMHSRDYYYKMRSFKPKSLASRAARFIYLNRTCWNGLYRVNQEGIFNVPIGTKESVIFGDDRFDEVSKVLQETELQACDFEQLIDVADKGDFIFADPPYTVRHNNNSFIKYNEKLFSWRDQERLCAALIRAKDRGAQVVATNACNQGLRDLYKSNFETLAVSRNSLISSKVETRKRFEELVIFTGSTNER